MAPSPPTLSEAALEGKARSPTLVWDIVKVILVAVLTRYPFYEVVTLTVQKESLVPCTNEPCDYVRSFEGKKVPGSGLEVIRVQNGVERPIYLTHLWYGLLNQTESSVVVTSVDYNESKHVRKKEYMLRTENDTDPELREFLKNTANMTGAMNATLAELPKNYVSWRKTMFALSVCTRVAQLVSWPQFFVSDWVITDSFIRSRFLPHQRIPSAYTNSTRGTPEEVCAAQGVMKNITSGMDDGPSKKVYVWALGGWTLCTVIHDLMLIGHKPAADDHHRPLELPEEWSLLVASLSFLFHMIATAACFYWSSGALSIFAAEVQALPLVVCYYRLQRLRAFVALSTPLVLLYMLMSKMQALATSMLCGDYIYTEQHHVPFRTVSKSPAWHEGSNVIHDIPSPHHHCVDDEVVKPNWRLRLYELCFLDHALLLMQVFVIAPAGYSIMVNAGEFVSRAMHYHGKGSHLPWLAGLAFRAPSVIFVITAFLQFLELVYRWAVLPFTGRTCYIRVADLIRPFLIPACWAAGSCLWPDGSLLEDLPEQVSLFQAELWGSGGVTFFLCGISSVRSNVFSIRPQLKTLRKKVHEEGSVVIWQMRKVEELLEKKTKQLKHLEGFSRTSKTEGPGSSEEGTRLLLPLSERQERELTLGSSTSEIEEADDHHIAAARVKVQAQVDKLKADLEKWKVRCRTCGKNMKERKERKPEKPLTCVVCYNAADFSCDNDKCKCHLCKDCKKEGKVQRSRGGICCWCCTKIKCYRFEWHHMLSSLDVLAALFRGIEALLRHRQCKASWEAFTEEGDDSDNDNDPVAQVKVLDEEGGEP